MCALVCECVFNWKVIVLARSNATQCGRHRNLSKLNRRVLSNSRFRNRRHRRCCRRRQVCLRLWITVAVSVSAAAAAHDVYLPCRVGRLSAGLEFHFVSGSVVRSLVGCTRFVCPTVCRAVVTDFFSFAARCRARVYCCCYAVVCLTLCANWCQQCKCGKNTTSLYIYKHYTHFTHTYTYAICVSVWECVMISLNCCANCLSSTSQTLTCSSLWMCVSARFHHTSHRSTEIQLSPGS